MYKRTLRVLTLGVSHNVIIIEMVETRVTPGRTMRAPDQGELKSFAAQLDSALLFSPHPQHPYPRALLAYLTS